MIRITIIYALIFTMLIASGCASVVKISSVAEKNKDGKLLLKWEVSPDQDGKINIYSSGTDTIMDYFTPIQTSDIADQVTVISENSPEIRQFFILKTTSAYSGIISNRVIDMINVKNFRDFGGYFVKNDRQIKWGMLFRCGDLSSINLYDQERIRRLNIKTIVDLRSEKTSKKFPIIINPSIQKISLSISPLDFEKMDEQMQDNKLNRSDAIRYVQNSYIKIIENNKQQYAEMFDVLTGYSNYPILFAGSLGKDRVGLAAYFILYALGVQENIIEQDYLLSNQTINISKIVKNAQDYPEYFQEAITALLTVNSAYIVYATDYIKQKYGSIDNYLEKELRVTKGKKNLLRKYLLYNQ